MGWGVGARWGGGGLAGPLTVFAARRYHTGSLAFGALILAIVQIIRVMLEYLDQRLKGAGLRAAGIGSHQGAGLRGRQGLVLVWGGGAKVMEQ